MPDNMTKDNTTTVVDEKDDKKALYTAITKLMLNLKGDGTLSSLQNKIGIHRNVLSAIFKVYYGQKSGNKVLTKSESPKEKKLYWEMDSLITIAEKLGIRVSELVRAAEDVRDGLPAWFQLRIARGTISLSIDMLEHIFLEALGCFTYAAPFPPSGSSRKERQYRRRDSSEISSLTGMADLFTENEVSELNYIIPPMFENDVLKKFVDAYQSEEITSLDSFIVLKRAVEEVKRKWRIEGKFEPRQLFELRSEVVNEIRIQFNILLDERAVKKS